MFDASGAVMVGQGGPGHQCLGWDLPKGLLSFWGLQGRMAQWFWDIGGYKKIIIINKKNDKKVVLKLCYTSTKALIR